MPLALPVSLSFLFGYAAAAGSAGGLAGYCLYRCSGRGARAFGLTMGAVLLWSLGALGRTAVSTAVAWYGLTFVMYTGIVSVSVLFFVFTVRYTESRRRLTGRRVAGLFVVPAVSLLLLATNPLHGLFFADVARSVTAGMVGFRVTAGPWFWVHSLYSYALLAGGTLGLLRVAAVNRGHYQRQALPLVLGVVLPWGTNIAYVFGPAGDLSVDPTPVGFALGGVFITYAVFRAGLTDLTPVPWSSVVDAIDDAVLVLDDRRRLVDYNDSAAALLGDDPLGEAVSEHLPASLSNADGEATAFDTNGTERWYRSREIPMEEMGSVLLVSDVTEGMRRRRQLREQNERLEEFTRVAAHDLRNPLNAITGYTELARETGEISHLKQVNPATDRMETLVDDLLTLGEEGQVVEDTEPVSIAEVTERAWSNVEMGPGTLQAVEDGWILADETRLTNLLEKLFRNCVEHGADGDGDSVAVRIGMLSDGFFVADDGIGIPTDARADVFEYGYSTHGGTGLGLPVVRSIAVAHGWEVSVTDSDDGGARFEFRSVQLHDGPRRKRPDVDTPWGRPK